MASTVIQPIADALGALAVTLGAEGVVWGRGALPGVGPWAVIGLPALGRTEPEEAEPQLGSNGWDLDFEVTLLMDVAEPKASHTRLAALVEEWIKAVDGGRSLGLVFVLDASVERAVPIDVEVTGSPRRLIGYETTVSVLALVAG